MPIDPGALAPDDPHAPPPGTGSEIITAAGKLSEARRTPGRRHHEQRPGRGS